MRSCSITLQSVLCILVKQNGTDSKIKGGFVTFLSHAKKLTMQVKFSGLLSTFWCHGNSQYLSFLFEKKPCFSDDPF